MSLGDCRRNFTLGGGAVRPNMAMKKATIQGDDLLF